jgi:hypothetical protein
MISNGAILAYQELIICPVLDILLAHGAAQEPEKFV